MPSRRGIPLESSLLVEEEEVSIIDLVDIKLINSVRKELNQLRNVTAKFSFTEPDHLGIIIPYRNRKEHLERFLPYLQYHLGEQKVDHSILVVEQLDSRPFNRAALLNAGAQFFGDRCDAFCFHDVDLLPVGTKYQVGTQPLNLVSDRRNEVTNLLEVMPAHFFGGVTTIDRDQFFQVDGFSNHFWGWGMEDDNFLFRCLFAGLQPCRLANSSYVEMDHHPGMVANIDGAFADEEELSSIRENLKRSRKHQSNAKRRLVDPKIDGLSQLEFEPDELPPVFDCLRIGVDLDFLPNPESEICEGIASPQRET